MIADILDIRTENNSICYLARISLFEYIDNIPDDYKDYDVQREIVSNVYLDNLVETVFLKKHIPPIVLIANKFAIEDQTISIQEFKILDGLQRTYRLNAIWKTLTYFIDEKKKDTDILQLNKYSLARKYAQLLGGFESTTRILASIIEVYKSRFSFLSDEKLTDCYIRNYQWFEIWTNLTPKEEVEKMLILNAGHKPVKIKHQLEIIFSNILPLLSGVNEKQFRIVREKEISSTQFSKNRQKGQFHFSHLISALISFKEAAPVTTNSALIQQLQNSDFNSEKDNKYFSFEFLESYISSLLEIEELVASTYDVIGIKWMGREVSLTGIYGAFGKKVSQYQDVEFLANFLNVKNVFIGNIKYLNLNAFENARNSLELSKINIGSVNKNAIFNATYYLISQSNPSEINWFDYFNS